MHTITPPIDVEGLHASEPESLPFARSMHVRAFLLERERDNILIYTNGAVAQGEHGGAARQYLNHWHEAMFAPDRVVAPVFIHEDDRAEAAERLPVRATFSKRHRLDDDFEVIPIPGHTAGATAYLWDNGEHRFLFTGDSVYLTDGEWMAAVLDSSDRVAYVESLDLMSELEFDVLVPWAASANGPVHGPGRPGRGAPAPGRNPGSCARGREPVASLRS